jgi:hypothetical protein
VRGEPIGTAVVVRADRVGAAVAVSNERVGTAARWWCGGELVGAAIREVVAEQERSGARARRPPANDHATSR